MSRKSEITFKMVLIVLAIFFFARVVSAETYKFEFHDNGIQVMKLVVEAPSQEKAMLKAGHVCFNVLTKGKYQGEEKGMEIIDICANPKISK